MSYIGNTNTTQGFSPAIDYFNGTGSQTAFTLSRPVASVAQVVVVVNNVTQNPSSAYTVSGNTITFTGAPSSGTSNIYVSYTSPITQTQALTQSPSVIGPMYVSLNAGTPIGGATNPIMGLSGAANNYVQGYVNNTTNGVNSSADLVAYPSNGTDASGWVDMGITSPTYSQAAFSVTGPNESYLFGSAPSGSGTTGNLVIATDSTGTANAIQFYTGGFNQAKSAARMVIDGSGNVGIGTSSPSYTNAGRVAVTINGSTDSVFTMNYGGTVGLYAQSSSTQGLISTTGSLPLVLGTGSAERARIDSSGNLLVGVTAAVSGSKLRVTNSTNTNITAYFENTGTGNCLGIQSSINGASNTSSWHFSGVTQGINTWYLYGNGTTSYSSDERLKRNIQTTRDGYLDDLMKLRVVKYQWKTDDTLSQQTELGLIAQEVEQVFPGLVQDAGHVSADGETYKVVKHSVMEFVLIKAIQEQQALITAMREELDAVKAKVNA